MCEREMGSDCSLSQVNSKFNIPNDTESQYDGFGSVVFQPYFTNDAYYLQTLQARQTRRLNVGEEASILLLLFAYFENWVFKKPDFQ